MNEMLVEATSKVVSGFLSRNEVDPERIPALIAETAHALTRVGGGEDESRIGPSRPPMPAVPVSLSVQDDYIVCLEDGEKLKMMKRHLWSKYRLTPEDYRSRWGLPPDYPMTAPNYARQRSILARKGGLGQRPVGRFADLEAAGV